MISSPIPEAHAPVTILHAATPAFPRSFSHSQTASYLFVFPTLRRGVARAPNVAYLGLPLLPALHPSTPAMNRFDGRVAGSQLCQLHT